MTDYHGLSLEGCAGAAIAVHFTDRDIYQATLRWQEVEAKLPIQHNRQRSQEPTYGGRIRGWVMRGYRLPTKESAEALGEFIAGLFDETMPEQGRSGAVAIWNGERWREALLWGEAVELIGGRGFCPLCAMPRDADVDLEGLWRASGEH